MSESHSSALASSQDPNRQLMDVGCITEQTQRLNEILCHRIIGQDPAMEALTCGFTRVFSLVWLLLTWALWRKTLSRATVVWGTVRFRHDIPLPDG